MKKNYFKLYVLTVLSVFATISLVAATGYTWQEWGFGGGGKYQAPGIHSADNSRIIVCGNMGGTFISNDGAKNFTQVPYQNMTSCMVNDMRPRNPWVFSPNNPKCIFGKQGNRILRTMTDGRRWYNLGYRIRETKKWLRGFKVFSICAMNNRKDSFLVVGTFPTSKEIVVLKTISSGYDWSIIAKFKDDNRKLMDIYSCASDEKTIVIVKKNEIIVSRNFGKSWEKASGLDVLSKTTIRDFAGGGNRKKDKLYLSLVSNEIDGKNIGGVYVSEDRGASWKKSIDSILIPLPEALLKDAKPQKSGWTGNGVYKYPAFFWLSCSSANPDVAFVCLKGCYMLGGYDNFKLVEKYGANIYRTTDGGKSWQAVLFQNPGMSKYNIKNMSWLANQWGWAQCPTGVYVSSSNPNYVMATSGATAFISDNMGKTWKQIAARQNARGEVPRGGMMNTTVMKMAFAPYNSRKMYICTSDYGGVWRSDTKGETWNFSTQIYRPGLGNNGYDIAFDPFNKGKIWAAVSLHHDVPISNVDDTRRNVSGIVVSTDYGITWKKLKAKGLPKLPYVVTRILVDRNSTKGNIKLWAAICGKGIYYSANNGINWVAKNNGIDPANLNIYQIEQTSNGLLYALSVIKAPGNVVKAPGNIYVSSDNGDSWRNLKPGKNAFISPLSFAIDRSNENVIYLAASKRRIWQNSRESEGIWKTVDGGNTWSRIFNLSTVNVSINPHKPSHIFACPWGRGLHESLDGGKTWRKTSYPFWRPLGVMFDPTDQDNFYVYSYGSCLWKGTFLKK